MAEENERPIVIKKIKKGGHGHHGGAWKVAYADFVTAMMAFFLLLWLLSNATDETLKGLSEYFMPTVGLKDQMGIGFAGGNQIDTKDGIKNSKNKEKGVIYGAPSVGAIVKMPDSVVKELDEIDAKNFTSVQNDLYKAINDNPELKEYSEQVLISETPEGLRIQILDHQKRPMFNQGGAEIAPYIKRILAFLAQSIKYIPNYVSISGHTPSNYQHSSKFSDLWELSAARANAARQFLVDGNLDPEQIARIVGKGDQEPLDQDIYAPENSRISITLMKSSILPYTKRSAP